MEFDLNIFLIYFSRKNKTVILGQTRILLGKFPKECFVGGHWVMSLVRNRHIVSVLR